MHAKRIFGLVTAATATEGALLGVFISWGKIGGDGGNFIGVAGLVLHALALMISEALNIGSSAIENALCIGIGTMQWWLLFAGVLWVRGWLKRSRPNRVAGGD